MDITRLFGSQPKFQLGNHVFSLDSYSEVNDEVVCCKSYGVITAIKFCPENSAYLGWTYELQVYKIISGTAFKHQVNLYPNLLYYDAYEIDLYMCPKKIDILKIINSLKLKQSEIIKKNLG